ncbi:MAG: hypothetical protein WC485_08360 [Opitutaceae bacterium]
MKTALKVIMLLLGAFYPGIAFAGLVGIASPAAFFNSEVAFSFFAVAGLLLIGLHDYTYRRVPLRVPGAKPCAVVPIGPDRTRPAGRLRREGCIAA